MLEQTENRQSVPYTILQVAFQPTARGGKTHFVAGNIRLVSAARDLLDSSAREVIAESAWMTAYLLEFGEDDEKWQAWLEHQYHIDDEERGNIAEEQLLIEKQQMYSCSICQNTI